MRPGPMEEAAGAALDIRRELALAENFEAVAAVEIDVVDAFKRIMRDGSPNLRLALARAALPNHELARAA